jgi:hypothetical protein
MKKTYIEPKNTVVRINLETLVAASPTGDIVVKPSETPIEDPNDFGGREVINSRDAWEEW